MVADAREANVQASGGTSEYYEDPDFDDEALSDNWEEV